MAEATTTTETVETESSGAGKKKLIILAVVALVAGGLGFAVFSGMLFGGDEAEASEPEPVAEGVIAEVATLTTNIGGNDPGFLRVGFAAVLAEGTVADTVADRYPLLKDAVLSEASRFTRAELETTKGLDRLRQALTERAQAIYPDGEVLRIVLTDLLVQ